MIVDDRPLGAGGGLPPGGGVASARGHPIGMAVNVSARQLDRDGFVERRPRGAARQRPRPAALTLEITETALMRDADADRRAAAGRQGARRPHRDRRLRHRLQLARLPAPVPRRRPEDRPLASSPASPPRRSPRRSSTRSCSSARRSTSRRSPRASRARRAEALQGERCDSGAGLPLRAAPSTPTRSRRSSAPGAASCRRRSRRRRRQDTAGVALWLRDPTSRSDREVLGGAPRRVSRVRRKSSSSKSAMSRLKPWRTRIRCIARSLRWAGREYAGTSHPWSRRRSARSKRV